MVRSKHGTRRNRILLAEATKMQLPVSTYVGRGLNRMDTSKTSRSTAVNMPVFDEVAGAGFPTCTDMGNGVMGSTEDPTANRAALLAKPLTDLDLPHWIYRALDEEPIRTVGQLIDLTEEDLLDIKGIGDKAVNRPGGIKERLRAQEPPLYLKDDPDTPAA